MSRALALASLVSLLLIGCAPSQFSELGKREQDRYLRCLEVIGPAYCKGDYDITADSKSVCGREMADRYARQRSEAGRKSWLLHHGCPAGRVSQ
jgi:hypothetical protein